MEEEDDKIAAQSEPKNSAKKRKKTTRGGIEVAIPKFRQPDEPAPKRRGRSKKQVTTKSSSEESLPPPEKKSRKRADNKGSSDEYNNVRYDPYKNGCTRPGLRVRKYTRPWWIPSWHNVNNIGVVFGEKSKSEWRAERTLEKKMKEDHIRPSQFLKSSTDTWLLPSEKLKAFEQQRDGILKNRKMRAMSKENKKPTQNVMSSEDGGSNSSMYSCITSGSMSSLQNAVQAICNGTLPSTETPAAQCAEFVASHLSNIKFVDCGNGMSFGNYYEGGRDGYLKFLPGGFKPKGRSKTASLKYLCLKGKLEFTFQNKPQELELMSYLHINPGNQYVIRNTSETEEALVYFTRFDEKDVTSSTTSVVST